MSVMQHPRNPNFCKFLAQNPCVWDEIISESVFLKHKLLKPATKLLKLGDELLSLVKVKVQCGEQPGGYERQLGASSGGSCVRRALGPGETKGTCTPKGSTC